MTVTIRRTTENACLLNYITDPTYLKEGAHDNCLKQLQLMNQIKRSLFVADLP